jgi:hypothetical protein
VNAALFYAYPEQRIVGSLLDALEYHLAIREAGGDSRLTFVCPRTGSFPGSFYEMCEDRYVLDPGWREGVSVIGVGELIRTRFDRVLVVDYNTVAKTRGLVAAESVLVISEKHTDDPAHLYDPRLYRSVTYFGEMPFERRDVEYRMRLKLDSLRAPDSSDSAVYVSSPGNDDRSFVDGLGLDPGKPVIFKSRRRHARGLFSLFDEYVYYHAGTWFDPHPRMMLECAFLGKRVRYFNPLGVVDGSYYRWVDLAERGLEDRQLGPDDEVVGRFL